MGAQEQEEGERGTAEKRRKMAAASDVSMDLDILDCPICFDHLRPPIFQCAVGHVLCSSCRAKLPDKCHLCFLTTGYNRCYMMEHVVESIKVSCFYGNLGCTEKITYYGKEEHKKVCPYAPCRCPTTGCTFSGSTMMLLSHFSDVHKWHKLKIPYNKAYRMCIALGSTVIQGEDGHLFLVNMVEEPLGGVISVFCIQPHITESNFKCILEASCSEVGYSQITMFQAKSTNLFEGFPKDCFLFVLPMVLLKRTGTNVTAMVNVTLIPP
ncbi:hypothetical protein ACP70R_030367 [Stipagrostis hirtigluma subsp. patula]